MYWKFGNYELSSLIWYLVKQIGDINVLNHVAFYVYIKSKNVNVASIQIWSIITGNGLKFGNYELSQLTVSLGINSIKQIGDNECIETRKSSTQLIRIFIEKSNASLRECPISFHTTCGWFCMFLLQNFTKIFYPFGNLFYGTLDFS